MAEPTLTQVFGANATQSSTTITISKNDLAAMGLTAGANNKAEALFSAIVKLAATYLTPAALDSNIDQSIVISAPTISVDERFNNNFLVQNFTVGFQKLIADSNIEPDDL